MLVVDSGAINSDYRPLTGGIDVKWDNTSSNPGYVKPIPNTAVSVRWDKALNKEIPEFWKCLRNKLKRKVLKDVQINGTSDN